MINAVNTGDGSPIVLFSAMALVSGIILLIAALVSMKRKKSERECDRNEEVE